MNNGIKLYYFFKYLLIRKKNIKHNEVNEIEKLNLVTIRYNKVLQIQKIKN